MFLSSSTFIIFTDRWTLTSFIVILFTNAHSAHSQRSTSSNLIADSIGDSVEDSATRRATTLNFIERRGVLLDEQPSPSSKNEPIISVDDVRLRCQGANGDFLESATDCEDQNRYCEENFPILTPPNSTTTLSQAKRPNMCDNSALYEEALQCARTCKICCERTNIPQKVTAAASTITAAFSVGAASPAPAAVEAAAAGLKSEALSKFLKLLQEQSVLQQQQQTTTTPVSPPSSHGIAQNASGGCADDSSFLMECRFVAGQCTSDERWIATLIRACPRTCGICDNLVAHRSRGPLTESVDAHNATACQDKYLTCADVKPALCEDSEHGPLFQRRCPATCQKCFPSSVDNQTVCEDRGNDCQEPEKIALCRNPQYRTLLYLQCRKTCKFCVGTPSGPDDSDANKRTTQHRQPLRSINSGTSSAELPPPPPPPPQSISGPACVDRNRNCPLWNNRGFCSSIFYEEQTKSYWCSFTCRLCVTTKQQRIT